MTADAEWQTTQAAEHVFEADAMRTRAFLGYGVLVGPFYLVVGVLQGMFREGFSFARHPLSVLSNGSLGWIQIANFVISGFMVILAARGIRHVLGARARAAAGALMTFGIAMLVSAVCRADPVDGFPVGTPLGPPTSISTMGLMHFIAGTLGFTALGVSGLLFARVLARQGLRALATFSLVAGLVVLFGFFGGAAFAATTSGIIGIWISVVAGWLWLAVLCYQLSTRIPAPAP